MSTLPLMSANYNHFANNVESPYVMLVYANWCGHCTQMEPAFVRAANTIGDSALVFRVEDQVMKHLLDQHPTNKLSQVISGTSGYPTIYKVSATGEKEHYNGPRDESSLTALFKAMPKAKKATPKKATPKAKAKATPKAKKATPKARA